MGLNTEHSWADAPIVGHLWEVSISITMKLFILIKFNLNKTKSNLAFALVVLIIFGVPIIQRSNVILSLQKVQIPVGTMQWTMQALGL